MTCVLDINKTEERMNSKLLFPYQYRRPGTIILVIGIMSSIISTYYEDIPLFDLPTFAIFYSELFKPSVFFSLIEDNLLNEISGILLILGGILVAFSKEKEEDEFYQKIRLESLLWATYINYAVMIFMILFIYGFGFLHVMIYNIFTIMFLFIIKYKYSVHKLNRALYAKQD